MIVIGWIPSQAVREAGNGSLGRATRPQGWRQIEKLHEQGMKTNGAMKTWKEAERRPNGPLEDKSPTGEAVKQPSCLTEEILPQSDPKSDYSRLNSKLNRWEDERGVNVLPPACEGSPLLAAFKLNLSGCIFLIENQVCRSLVPYYVKIYFKSNTLNSECIKHAQNPVFWWWCSLSRTSSVNHIYQCWVFKQELITYLWLGSECFILARLHTQGVVHIGS